MIKKKERNNMKNRPGDRIRRMKSGRGRVFEEHSATDDWHGAFNVGYSESTKEKEMKNMVIT